MSFTLSGIRKRDINECHVHYCIQYEIHKRQKCNTDNKKKISVVKLSAINMHTKNSLENLKNSNSDLSDKVQSGRSTTM